MSVCKHLFVKLVVSLALLFVNKLFGIPEHKHLLLMNLKIGREIIYEIFFMLF